MPKKPAPAKAAPKSTKNAPKTGKITTTLAPRHRPSKKPKAKKASAQKRYEARAAKREAWAQKNPDMVPGSIGQPATMKPVETKQEELVAAAEEATQDSTPAEA